MNQLENKKIKYENLFWLFILGSLLGVLLEGVWSIIRRGAWETHVVTIWGPYCIIYGFGLVIFYVCAKYFNKKPIIKQFIIYTLIGTFVELFCGLFLEFGLSMRAWNYSKQFLNIRGHVSLKMALMWGVLGLLFGLILKYIDRFLNKLDNKPCNFLCKIFTIYMAINLLFTSVVIIRWKDRHFNQANDTLIGNYIDKKYSDTFMEKRYMEWYFIK